MTKDVKPLLSLFYCYAHKDRNLRDKLDSHLLALYRSKCISSWYDGNIIPGQSWEQKIEQQLNTADIILLLISPDFINSDYCYSKEMTQAIRRHQTGEALVLPILLRPVDWTDTPFAGIQMLPSNTKPITTWSNRDKALENVAIGIRQVVNDLLRQRGHPSIPPETRGADTSQALVQGASSQVEVCVPILMPQSVDLIGRDNELEHVKEAVQYGKQGGVCFITGMSAVGKSALAAKVAREFFENNRANFPGGVAWISCEGLNGYEGLAELYFRIAGHLNLDSGVAGMKPEQMRIKLAQILARRARTLLVLDNLESGLDVDTIVETLALPGYTSLVITGIHLTIHVEVDGWIFLEPLEAKDAQQLFIKQLQKDDSSRPNAKEKDIVPKLVEPLGGLPLAIGLTASYAVRQKMNLKDVLDEIYKDGLRGAGLDDPSRRGLRKRFDRSWEALSEHQQQLFAGLSLLTSSTFPRAAAEAIAQSTGTTHTYPRQNIAALIAAMLVGAVAEQEEPIEVKRLRLHPQLRYYATEQLRTLPIEIQEKMGDAALDFWSSYANRHRRSGEDLIREAEGLMGILAWAYEYKRYKELLLVVHILSKPWETIGRRIEAGQFYTWAIEGAIEVNDLSEQNWFMLRSLLNEEWLGRTKVSHADFQPILDLAVKSQNLDIELILVNEVAKIDEIQGYVENAQIGFRRVLELAKRLEHSTEKIKAECDAIHGLSRSASKQAERILAGEQEAQKVNSYKQLKVIPLQAEQKLQEAREGFERELHLIKLLNEPFERMEIERGALHELARLDELQDKLKEARQGFEQALALSYELGNHFYIAMDQRHLGFAIGCEGNFKKGSGMIKETLEYFKESGDLYASGLCYLCLAELERNKIRKQNDKYHKQSISYFHEALWRFERGHYSPRAERARKELRKLGEDI